MSQIEKPGTAAAPPRVRLEAIGDAWQLMKPQLLAWMGATLIALLCGVVVGGVYFVFEFAHAVRAAALHGVSRPSIGAYLLLDVVGAALMAVFGGGMTRMAIHQARGETVEMADLWGATDVFGRLCIYFLVLSVIPTLVAVLPLGLVLSFLVSLVLGGLLLFTVPLIVDQRLDVMEAVRRSIAALRGQLPMAVLFLVLTGLMAAVGGILCIVPALFTIPLGMSAIGLLYRDFFPEAPPAEGQ